jgi:hypothetical protein
MRVFTSNPTLTLMDGVDVSQPLAPTAVSAKAPYDTDSSLDGISSRWSFCTALDWATTATAGTVIATLPVSPFSDFSFNATNPYLNPYPASLLGIGSKYWRCTMKYRVFIPASSFHRGVLQVVWYPGTVYNQASRDPTNIAPNVLFEVAAGAVMDITVGFAAQTPVLPVHHMSPSFGGTTYNSFGSANGFLEFRVATKLTAPTATPLKIVVLVCAVDVEFYGQCSTLATEFNSWPLYGVRVESGTVGDSGQTITEVVLVPRAPLLGSSMAGYTVTSAAAMMQQYQYCSRTTNVGAGNRGITYTTRNTLGGRCAFSLDDSMQTIISDFPSTIPTLGDIVLSMFCGWQGTQRFAFSISSISAGMIYLLQDAPFTSSTTTTRADSFVAYTGYPYPLVDNATEVIYVSSPFLSTDTYCKSGSLKNTEAQDTLNTSMIWEGDTLGVGLRLDVWKAYGSDITPVMFRTTTRLRLYNIPLYPTS